MNNAGDGFQVRMLLQQTVGILAGPDNTNRVAAVAPREPGTQP
ncbi:hypothetical protein [Stenotrophomonas maltophilia]|nr:hypothetical protein [Stenotrophomonas maltophilia]MDT3486369.1 hypothetical protein [Stenotrophomonas maltophilia]